MIHGSLFSGIGGFDLGFERAGIKTIWQVEIDAYCRRVLARHFPEAERYDDIRTVGKHNLAPVDIVSGGFPCQDISNAGKRAGIDGERSGLWSEYARIIRELRPHYVVVENVAALLHRGIERVLGDLAACGYDAEWQSIRASDVGAPHRRERIWIIAYAVGSRIWEQSIFDAECSGATISVNDCEDVADSSSSGMESEQLSAKGDLFLADTDRCGPIMANADGRGLTVQGESPRPNGLASRSGEDVANATGIGCQQMEQSISRRTFVEGTSGTTEHGGISKWRGWWAVEPDVGRVAHGVSRRVDRLRGLGNAIVPQIAEYIGRQIKNAS